MTRFKVDPAPSIKDLCEYFGISRQSFYKWLKYEAKRRLENHIITSWVKENRKVQKLEGCYKLWLKHKVEFNIEMALGRDKFFDLMRDEGLLIRRKRKYVKTTNSEHGFRVYSNKIKELKIVSPNQVWVCDITYIATTEGFMYLALITDLYSRKIVGYDISDSLEAEGCRRALKRALALVKNPEGIIHHSDRGIQYCCKEYIKLLKKHKIEISMAAKGDCYENAVAERVNGILKQEYDLGSRFITKDIAVKATKEAVNLYNTARLHRSINFKTPAEMYAA
ncbi:MAG: IS3 family transposase [Bacteroidales bacterium]|nr:IS3 family transposase [Bacteroidales bacterium]